MNNVFYLNWNRLTTFFIPKVLRKTLILTFINSAVLPLKANHIAFLSFKKNTEYILKHNGQVVYLQKMLNDKFDKNERRIKVDNVKPIIPLRLYYVEDAKPLFSYHIEEGKPKHFFRSGYYYNEFDFIVSIPNDLIESVLQMQVQINYYKLFSKNYKIVTQ